MSVRRRLVAASAAALTGLALLGAPAAAAPDRSGDGRAAAIKRAEVTCRTAIWGVTSANRLMLRRTRNNSLVEPDHVLPGTLPSRATSIIYKDSGRDGDRWWEEMLTLNDDGIPRQVTVRGVVGSDETPTWSSRKLLNRGFRHRVLAGGGGFNYFAVDRAGNLKRWILFHNDRGGLYFGNGKVVRRGMGGLRTLTFGSQVKDDGQVTTLLYGTTRSGALLQIRVGDRAPRRTDDQVGKVRVVTLRKRGFAGYNAVSPTWCNANPYFHGLTYIDNKADLARLYTLKGAAAANPANLLNRGRVGRNVHWWIRTAF
jgi:hypothetical protein